MAAEVRRWGMILLAGALCWAASAGTLTVKVENLGAPVSGASVRVDPGELSGTTDANGKWADTVTPGNYRVSAWKTIGGALRGQIVNFTMPAAGDADVTLALTDAVWTYVHFPYNVGNSWQYQHRHTDAAGTEVSTWRERVVSSIDMGGEPAVVLTATKDGVHEWKEIRASTRDGFVLYTQQQGADEITFDPPVRLGPLMPLGYEWVATATAHHSDGSPDTHLLMRCRLTGFEAVTVPAGAFANCPRLEIVMTLGPETNQLRVWTSANVGIVRQVERNGERTNVKILEEYSVRPMLRPLRPLRPVLPRP
ncbi:MAG: carboxypeptidase-like regulatory domain-containing protein [Armatimonadota bacterium]